MRTFETARYCILFAHEGKHHPEFITPIQLPRRRTVSDGVARSRAKAGGWDD